MFTVQACGLQQYDSVNDRHHPSHGTAQTRVWIPREGRTYKFTNNYIFQSNSVQCLVLSSSVQYMYLENNRP